MVRSHLVPYLSAGLLASYLLACSKPPQLHVSKSKSAQGEDSSEDSHSNGTSEGLSLDYARLSPASFRALVNKLGYIAGIDLKHVMEHKAMKELVANRNNLGDYDFSVAKTEIDLWQADQMKLWLKSLLPYCQDADLQKKYNLSIDSFALAAMGRKPATGELSDLQANSKLAADKKLVFEASCLAYLSSLEFRNQWPKANSTRFDYLNLVASTIIERPITQAEVASDKSTEEILKSWLESDRFVEASRHYVERLLGTSGKTEEVDFDMPGYLMAHIVSSQAPYSEIITSKSCYDNDGKAITCDSGAPFGAGVLTTRAILKKKAGAYNIARSNFTLGTFSCLSYPMSNKTEPKAAQTSLIDYFAQTDGQNVFGNGTNCYSCHSQFAKHAQLFVRFDLNGIYNAEAKGLGDGGSTEGVTKNGTAISHYKGSSQAGSEKSEYFGKPVANLAEATKVITKADTFLPCTVQKVLKHFLRVKPDQLDLIPGDIIDDIVANIRSEGDDPSFQTIIIKSLGNEKLIQAFLSRGEQ